MRVGFEERYLGARATKKSGPSSGRRARSLQIGALSHRGAGTPLRPSHDDGYKAPMTSPALPFPPPGSKTALEEGLVLTPRFGVDGLVTCVAVDHATGDVLMVAHMNAESLAKTIATGEAWYFSRSRQELWHKGATSGQIQRVVEMRVDCDQDAILLRVEVAGDGGCCHTGRRSCFYRRVAPGGSAGEARLEPASENLTLSLAGRH